jgi:hypothetical protein
MILASTFGRLLCSNRLICHTFETAKIVILNQILNQGSYAKTNGIRQLDFNGHCILSLYIFIINYTRE